MQKQATLALDTNTIAAMQNALQKKTALEPELDYFKLRGNLDTSGKRLHSGLATTVAFFGGSITEMRGWKEYMKEFLAASFPENQAITFIDAGAPSYDSTAHAFRAQQDVFSKGKVDLLFFEASVNDEYNGRGPRDIELAFDGVLHRAYENNPDMDIVFLYFIDDLKIEEFAKTGASHIIATQDAIAARYGIPAIDLSRHVNERMARGEFDWNTFGGLHPAPFGHKIYAERLAELLTAYWQAAPLCAGAEKHSHPAPQHVHAYTHGRLAAAADAVTSGAVQADGFEVTQSWRPDDTIETRPDFVDVPMLCGKAPKDSFTLTFSGDSLAVFFAAGPNSGIFHYSVDGGAAQTVDLYTEWSHEVHLPWVVVLAKELDAGEHRVTVTIADEKNEKSGGHDCIIRYFLLNDE